MKKYIRHFLTISRHKIKVGILCIRSGFFWRGIMHDNSKFSPKEFFSSAKFFQGDRSPIEAEKSAIGYSLGWQHHKGRNPHHWEYWIDNIGTEKMYAIKIPFGYLVEMICDFIGAGMVYHKKMWTKNHPLAYFEKYKASRIYHKTTLSYIEMFLRTLQELDLKPFLKWLRKNKKQLKNAYNRDEIWTEDKGENKDGKTD